MRESPDNLRECVSLGINVNSANGREIIVALGPPDEAGGGEVSAGAFLALARQWLKKHIDEPSPARDLVIDDEPGMLRAIYAPRRLPQ